jgi:hypothetical protein
MRRAAALIRRNEQVLRKAHRTLELIRYARSRGIDIR